MEENRERDPSAAFLSDPALTREEAEIIGRKLWLLLARRTEAYTAGGSSSVPVETAQELFASLSFTLGLYLKESNCPAGRLLTDDLNDLYKRGVRLIEKKLACAKKLYEAACLGAPAIENISFRDTMRNLGTFFRRYDYRFFAHQIPCAIDYQLCRAVPEEPGGVEYVTEYLRRVIIENDFLRRFDPDRVERLLMSSCPDYRGLLINLYEPAAANAVGLALLDDDVFSLDISGSGRARLAALFETLPETRMKLALREAAARLCQTLPIPDGAARDYLAMTAVSLAPRIAAALPYGGLDGIFLSLWTSH
jgi:hypothetical protein